MYIVYAPEAASEALARTLSGVGGIGCGPAEAAFPAGERALVLVTPDYYSRGFWRMKPLKRKSIIQKPITSQIRISAPWWRLRARI